MFDADMHSNKYIPYFQVDPSSVAGRDGRIKEGDQILQVIFCCYVLPLMMVSL